MSVFCSHFFLILGLMRINGFIVQQVSLLIETYYLTAGAVTGIDGKDSFLPQRRCQQKLAQVFSKNSNGIVIGFFF
jgi:hypothetical protein